MSCCEIQILFQRLRHVDHGILPHIQQLGAQSAYFIPIHVAYHPNKLYMLIIIS